MDHDENEQIYRKLRRVKRKMKGKGAPPKAMKKVKRAIRRIAELLEDEDDRTKT